MNYGSEPADQVVRYSLEGAEFALRISGTAAKNFFIFAQAVLHDSKKTHGKTHLIRLLKEQKPLKFFTVDKDRIAFFRPFLVPCRHRAITWFKPGELCEPMGSKRFCTHI